MALRLRDMAALARLPGIRTLSVWPSSMLVKPLEPQHRRTLGPAPFRHLEALTARVSTSAAGDLLSLVPHIAMLDLHVLGDRSSRTTNVLRPIAERLPHLRRLVVRFKGDFVVDHASLAALASRSALTVLELRLERYESFLLPEAPLSGGRWQAMLAQLPRLERLWLPRKCPVPDGNALLIAGMTCRFLRCVHLHNVWDISTLATLEQVTFPHLRTVVVESVGDMLPGEGYASTISITGTSIHLRYTWRKGDGVSWRYDANDGGGEMGVWG
jgi:hypothetical protein